MNILFVCTGNTCRSSMAEGLFKDMLKKNNIDYINISSAGISAFEGEMANEKAIKVLKSKGIDISNHKARQISDDLIKDSDLILTMTNSHKKMLSYNQLSKDKVFTLKEAAAMLNNEEINIYNLDIADPYGMDYNTYELTMKEIEKELQKIIKNIDKLQC